MEERFAVGLISGRSTTSDRRWWTWTKQSDWLAGWPVTGMCFCRDLFKPVPHWPVTDKCAQGNVLYYYWSKINSKISAILYHRWEFNLSPQNQGQWNLCSWLSHDGHPLGVTCSAKGHKRLVNEIIVEVWKKQPACYLPENSTWYHSLRT